MMQLDLPWYMLEGKIYDKNEKKYIDIGLSEDIADWLMQRGVYYLQNSFPNATVGRYPWDFDKKPQLLVHIVIDELFVKNNTMIVEGKVFINEQAKILRFEESLNTNLYKSIDKIFAKLLAFVVTEVDRSCQEALDTHF
ncbi:hypothetical protein NitYY0918_C0423 [Nitratiruptor sp. YY09-18]|nr:hypothetical protein NitYY0918_C0423 [Nitratiruptor sp. YY09-18]